MKVRIGGFGEPLQTIEVTHFEIVSEEDETRPMFYVYQGRDGVSLEISSGGTFKSNGKIYNRFAVHPNAANSITLRSLELDLPAAKKDHP